MNGSGVLWFSSLRQFVNQAFQLVAGLIQERSADAVDAGVRSPMLDRSYPGVKNECAYSRAREDL